MSKLKYIQPQFSFVLHLCKSWSHTFKECHGLNIFRVWVQKGIFGSKTENIIGKRRRLHNEGFHDQRKKSEMEGHVAGVGVRKG
jgi:hypothetical protein